MYFLLLKDVSFFISLSSMLVCYTHIFHVYTSTCIMKDHLKIKPPNDFKADWPASKSSERGNAVSTPSGRPALKLSVFSLMP